MDGRVGEKEGCMEGNNEGRGEIVDGRRIESNEGWSMGAGWRKEGWMK